MLYDLDIDKQREQFALVINHLKQTNHSQKDIAQKIGLTSFDISHIKSGSIKKISKEIIDNLHNEFNINPNFILKGASNMYDIPGIKYENFEEFVDNWNLVDHERKEYLHFSMDENFYKFLIDVYKLKEASIISDNTKEMKDAFAKAFESLKENFSTSNSSKEYVLLPVDDMIEIMSDNVSKRKELCNVLDILNLSPPKNK